MEKTILIVTVKHDEKIGEQDIIDDAYSALKDLWIDVIVDEYYCEF